MKQGRFSLDVKQKLLTQGKFFTHWNSLPREGVDALGGQVRWGLGHSPSSFDSPGRLETGTCDAV